MVRTRLVPLTAAALALPMLAGCSGEDAFSASGTVSMIGIGQAQVLAAGGSVEGDDCQGSGTLAAFDDSAEVVVLDSDGSKVAVGTLSQGTIPDGSSELEQLGFRMCEFKFKVDEIPGGDGLFTLKIDESETSFKQADAESIKVSIAG